MGYISFNISGLRVRYAVSMHLVMGTSVMDVFGVTRNAYFRSSARQTALNKNLPQGSINIGEFIGPLPGK